MDVPFVTNLPAPPGEYTENMYLQTETEIASAALVMRPGLTPIEINVTEDEA